MATRSNWAAGIATFAAGTSIALASCVLDVDFGATRFRCSESPECPVGQTCVGGYCEAAVARDAAASTDALAPGGDAMPAVPDAAPAGPDPRVGSLLFYSFDRLLARDLYEESGHRFDADLQGTVAPAMEAVYGAALDFDGGHVWVPKDPAIARRPPLTIEAWVRRDSAIAAEVVIGDSNPALAPYPTYELSLEPTPGGATFRSNDGCEGSAIAATSADTDVAAGEWVHIAVTWDGAMARFYRNGVRTDNIPLMAVPCVAPGSHVRIGDRNDGTAPFRGELDELKLSDYVKSREQIQASMAFDAAMAGPVCGDHITDGAESCDVVSACCDEPSCQLDTGGSCGAGACQSGVCVAAGGRIADGLVALYTFDEGTGTTVTDTSGVAPALDLEIGDPLAVTWQAGALTIDAPTAVASTVSADKIATACRASRELTIEAWIEPANETQSGPARVVTMSLDQTERNFQIGQVADRYQLRLRSALAQLNGMPQLSSQASDVTTGLTHVVATRDASGKRVLYVNGTPRDSNQLAGDFDNWDATFGLSLANEFGVDRAWLGTFHLVAIYDRALDVGEVGRNFTAGAD